MQVQWFSELAFSFTGTKGVVVPFSSESNLSQSTGVLDNGLASSQNVLLWDMGVMCGGQITYIALVKAWEGGREGGVKECWRHIYAALQ